MRGVCLLLVWIGALLAHGQEIWIDDGTDGDGDGTSLSPYHWGNSADQFDAGMRSLGPGTIIHLAHVPNSENTFQTRGAYANSVQPSFGFQVKSDQKILGGPGVVIQLVYVVPAVERDLGFNIALGAPSHFFSGGTGADGVVIQDLTLDCNGPALKRQRLYSTIQAIELAGERNTLRNLTVMNAIDDRSLSIGYDENFIVSLSSYEANSFGNMIDHCMVKDFIVDRSRSASRNIMCSAIAIRVRPGGMHSVHRISGTIQNCVVVLNGFKPGVYLDQEYALNANFATNLIVTGNTITGATRGFNNDAGPNASFQITGNIFNQPPNSCGVFLSTSSDSILRGNTFNLLGSGSIAIKVQGLVDDQEAVRWQIADNTIHCWGPGNNGIYFYPAPQQGPGTPTCIDVRNNRFLGEMAYINVPPKTTRAGNYFAGNTGNFRHYTPLTEPAGVPLRGTNRAEELK